MDRAGQRENGGWRIVKFLNSRAWTRTVSLTLFLIAPGLLQAQQAQQSAAQAQKPEAPTPNLVKAPPPSIREQLKQAESAHYSFHETPFHVDLPHSHNPFSAYMPSSPPPLNLTNSHLLHDLEIGGKLYLTLKEAIVLAIEDNLDIAYYRYNLPIAKTDLARTRAGGVANGVDTMLSQGTLGGYSSSPSSGGGGVAAVSAGGAGGLVTSTVGAGTPVHPWDPELSAQGYVEHETQQELNIVTTGTPLLHTNTTEGDVSYSQYFPLGTNIHLDYQGYRQTTNNLFQFTNPTFTSAFQFTINQPLLAGFGFNTNDRYIHIAKQNQKITNLGFRLQVAATISQVERIYWNLVNAYENELVKKRSLAFAERTLEDDQKKLQLKAIPALQVMKDEATVAKREGDLTVARANLRLNELYIKNALTKTVSDPKLVKMPVVPLTLTSPSDPNAHKPISRLIAEAEKNYPNVAMDRINMQKERQSLRAIRNSLLPSLSLFGTYAGTGLAGEPNPNCKGCISLPLPKAFGGAFENSFNYSAPDYMAGFKLTITLRNRIAKADQFRSELQYRQAQLQFEQEKKNLLFYVRNAQYALVQARARVVAAEKERNLEEKTFKITQQEQALGAKSSYDTLQAQHNLALAESALSSAEMTYAEAQVSLDEITGQTLKQTGVSIDEARKGIVQGIQP